MSGLQAQQDTGSSGLEKLLQDLCAAESMDLAVPGVPENQGKPGPLKRFLTWTQKQWIKAKDLCTKKYAGMKGVNQAFIKSMYKALFVTLLNAKGERFLEYSDGAIGVTGLLYCPQKILFKKQYPDIETMNIEIADGFVHEREVYEALLKLYGPQAVKKEVVLPYESPQGLKLEGHADIVLYGRNKVVCIECKATKFAYHNLPFNSVGDDEIMIWEPDLIERIHFNESYIEQSKIQKILLQRMYPGMEVEHYILEKTMIKLIPTGLKKIYLLRKTQENMSVEELEALITKYHENKDPRHSWECSYCGYFKEGVCPGKEIVEYAKIVGAENLPVVVQEAITAYLKAFDHLKTIDDYLKQALRGYSLKIGNGRGRVIGYHEKKDVEYDYQKMLAAGVPVSTIIDNSYISYRNRDKVDNTISIYTDLSEVKTVKTKLEWKGLI